MNLICSLNLYFLGRLRFKAP